MLEYMKFMIGGYIGWETIEISVINEKYIVKHQKALWADWSVFEDVDLIDWNTKLENVHINKWRKEYVNTGILDVLSGILNIKLRTRDADIFTVVMPILKTLMLLCKYWESYIRL